jgi:ABC-type oligopeptide transport system substrate-binding subunit
MQPRQSADAPHMMRHAWCADYMDAHNWLYELFHPTHSRNEIKWDNREFAKVVEKAMQSQDSEARKQLYKRAETILNSEETAIATLFYYADPHLVKSRVKNWAKMPLGGNHLRDWELSPQKGSQTLE